MGDAGRNECAASSCISTIDVESIEITKSDVVFSLKVNTGEKAYPLVRSYTDFFNLKDSLNSDFGERNDINIPTLRALKWFLQTRILFNDALSDKKRKSIQDFCKGLLQLPKDVQSSAPMRKFFEQANSTDDPANGSTVKVSGAQPVQPRTPPEGHLQQNMYVVVAPFTDNVQGRVSLQPGYVVEVLKREDERCFVHVTDTHEQGWALQSALKPLSAATPTAAQSNGAHSKPARYYAMMSCDGRNAGEISYNSGEILEVLETLPDGMVRIRHGDRTGVTSASNLQPLATEELDQEISVDPYFVTLNKTRTNPNPTNRISQELLQNVLPQQQVHYVVNTATYGGANSDNGGSGAVGQPVTGHPVTVSTPLPSTSGTTVTPPRSSATAADVSVPVNNEPPEPLYQQVILKKKPTVAVQPELNYAELDVIRQGGPIKKPVATDEVIYSEVLPMVPPKHLLLEPVPEKENYVNVRLRNKDSYENAVLVDTFLKKVREKSYRVSRDYISKDVKKTTRPTLNVSSGEIVQVELVEGGSCFCVVVGGNEQDVREGWLPRDILEEIAAESNDNIDVEIPVDQRTLKKISTTQKPIVPAAASTNQAADTSSKSSLKTDAKNNAPVMKTATQPARSVAPPVGGGTQEVWAQSLSPFSDTAPQVLSFESGCWAQVLSQDASGWWLVQLGEQKGWVPGNFWTIVDKSSPVSETSGDVPPPVPAERRVRTSASDQPSFVQCPWYYVGMSRVEAEQLLRTSGHKGSFVVRAGTSHNVDLCVSLMGDGRIHHFAIKYTPDGQLTMAQKNFRNMDKMIKHFSANPICYSENKEPCFLVDPLITKKK